MDAVTISRGLSLRAETPADRDFVAALFRADREPGFVRLGLPAAAVRTLLDDQFRLQARHFDAAYPGLDRAVVERRKSAVGRLYTDRTAARWLIVDIALLPQAQGQGTGAALIAWLAAEAARAGVPALELQVAHDNVRAAALYRRLGFVGVGGISASHLTMRRSLS